MIEILLEISYPILFCIFSAINHIIYNTTDYAFYFSSISTNVYSQQLTEVSTPMFTAYITAYITAYRQTASLTLL